MTREPRPRRYPPPEFPMRAPRLFAQTPPAIFPPVLGLLGLTSALRLWLEAMRLETGPGDLLVGVAVALWVFTALAYLGKILRRPRVVVEDLRVLPGRAGLAAMSIGGMAAGGLVALYWPLAGLVLTLAALVAHAVLAGLLVRLLRALPPAGREVNPTWHLSFVGFIVAGPSLVAAGQPGWAAGLLWATLPIALAIWSLSARQFLRAVPPAPLRPLLAVHLAPAALLASVAGLVGPDWLAIGMLGVAGLLALALIAGSRWLLVAGVSPLWGALAFPFAALAAALVRGGGVEGEAVAGVLILGLLGFVPAMLWWTQKRWSDGRLAKITNAAEA